MAVEWSKATEGDGKADNRYHRMKKFLGKGAFKEVFLGFDTVDQQDVAWNVVDLSKVTSESQIEKIKGETKILKSLKHNHILRFHDTWMADDRLIFITDLMRDGSLLEYIMNRDIALKTVKRYCRQILDALTYLHHGVGDPPKPVIHRDLKCDNIFIDAQANRVVIGDLGLSTTFGETRNPNQVGQSVVGTPEFMAPEMYEEKYDEKVDIYAFGMCVLQMVTKKYPYQECRNLHQVYKKVTERKLPDALNTVRAKSVKDFIILSTKFVPEMRPTADQLKDHPFLRYEYPIDGLSCSHSSIVSRNPKSPTGMKKAPLAKKSTQQPGSLTPIHEDINGGNDTTTSVEVGGPVTATTVPSNATSLAVHPPNSVQPSVPASNVSVQSHMMSNTAINQRWDGRSFSTPLQHIMSAPGTSMQSANGNRHIGQGQMNPPQTANPAQIVKAEIIDGSGLPGTGSTFRIFLKVVCRMASATDRGGSVAGKSVSFDYRDGEDTPQSVAAEMVNDLQLEPKDQMLRAIEAALSPENIQSKIQKGQPASMVTLNEVANQAPQTGAASQPLPQPPKGSIVAHQAQASTDSVMVNAHQQAPAQNVAHQQTGPPLAGNPIIGRMVPQQSPIIPQSGYQQPPPPNQQQPTGATAQQTGFQQPPAPTVAAQQPNPGQQATAANPVVAQQQGGAPAPPQQGGGFPQGNGAPAQQVYQAPAASQQTAPGQAHPSPLLPAAPPPPAGYQQTPAPPQAQPQAPQAGYQPQPPQGGGVTHAQQPAPQQGYQQTAPTATPQQPYSQPYMGTPQTNNGYPPSYPAGNYQPNPAAPAAFTPQQLPAPAPSQPPPRGVAPNDLPGGSPNLNPVPPPQGVAVVIQVAPPNQTASAAHQRIQQQIPDGSGVAYATPQPVQPPTNSVAPPPRPSDETSDDTTQPAPPPLSPAKPRTAVPVNGRGAQPVPGPQAQQTFPPGPAYSQAGINQPPLHSGQLPRQTAPQSGVHNGLAVQNNVAQANLHRRASPSPQLPVPQASPGPPLTLQPLQPPPMNGGHLPQSAGLKIPNPQRSISVPNTSTTLRPTADRDSEKTQRNSVHLTPARLEEMETGETTRPAPLDGVDPSLGQSMAQMIVHHDGVPGSKASPTNSTNSQDSKASANNNGNPFAQQGLPPAGYTKNTVASMVVNGITTMSPSPGPVAFQPGRSASQPPFHSARDQRAARTHNRSQPINPYQNNQPPTLQLVRSPSSPDLKVLVAKAEDSRANSEPGGSPKRSNPDGKRMTPGSASPGWHDLSCGSSSPPVYMGQGYPMNGNGFPAYPTNGNGFRGSRSAGNLPGMMAPGGPKMMRQKSNGSDAGKSRGKKQISKQELIKKYQKQMAEETLKLNDRSLTGRDHKKARKAQQERAGLNQPLTKNNSKSNIDPDAPNTDVSANGATTMASGSRTPNFLANANYVCLETPPVTPGHNKLRLGKPVAGTNGHKPAGSTSPAGSEARSVATANEAHDQPLPGQNEMGSGPLGVGEPIRAVSGHHVDSEGDDSQATSVPLQETPDRSIHPDDALAARVIRPTEYYRSVASGDFSANESIDRKSDGGGFTAKSLTAPPGIVLPGTPSQEDSRDLPAFSGHRLASQNIVWEPSPVPREQSPPPAYNQQLFDRAGAPVTETKPPDPWGGSATGSPGDKQAGGTGSMSTLIAPPAPNGGPPATHRQKTAPNNSGASSGGQAIPTQQAPFHNHRSEPTLRRPQRGQAVDTPPGGRRADETSDILSQHGSAKDLGSPPIINREQVDGQVRKHVDKLNKMLSKLQEKMQEDYSKRLNEINEMASTLLETISNDPIRVGEVTHQFNRHITNLRDRAQVFARSDLSFTPRDRPMGVVANTGALHQPPPRGPPVNQLPPPPAAAAGPGPGAQPEISVNALHKQPAQKTRSPDQRRDGEPYAHPSTAPAAPPPPAVDVTTAPAHMPVVVPMQVTAPAPMQVVVPPPPATAPAPAAPPVQAVAAPPLQAMASANPVQPMASASLPLQAVASVAPVQAVASASLPVQAVAQPLPAPPQSSLAPPAASQVGGFAQPSQRHGSPALGQPVQQQPPPAGPVTIAPPRTTTAPPRTNAAPPTSGQQ